MSARVWMGTRGPSVPRTWTSVRRHRAVTGRVGTSRARTSVTVTTASQVRIASVEKDYYVKFGNLYNDNMLFSNQCFI